jgi:hypothetical protein
MSIDFKLHIQLGNDTARTNEDVSNLLTKVQRQLLQGHLEGVINDENGNAVGSWRKHDNGPASWKRHPKYGDLMTLEEFEENVACFAITPDDGSGVWATESLVSPFSCWGDRPEEATHVMWYNK